MNKPLKTPKSYSFSEEVKEIAKIRSQEEGRSVTNYIEWLIRNDANS